MQTVLEQGSIDKPLTFDIGLIQLSFIPVCSLNTCNISVKLCRGFAALQCFSLLEVLLPVHGKNRSGVYYIAGYRYWCMSYLLVETVVGRYHVYKYCGSRALEKLSSLCTKLIKLT